MFTHLLRTVAILSCLGGSTAYAQMISMQIDLPHTVTPPNDDSLFVRVKVTSVYEIQSVVAHAADRQASLGNAGSNWKGDVDITGLPHGPGQPLYIEATDALGNTAMVTTTYTHDNPPILEVTAPIALSVGRPQIRVTASCSDDFACTKLQVIAGTSGLVAEVAGNVMDQDVDAPTGNITVKAWDSVQNVSATIPIFREPSDKLVDVFAAPTEILDTRLGQVAYVTDSGFAVTDLSTDTTNYVTLPGPAKTVTLMEHGAMATIQGMLYFVHGSFVEEYVGRDLRTAGNWVTWRGMENNVGFQYRMDTGSAIVPEMFPAEYSAGDVASNGSLVFYSHSSGLYRADLSGTIEHLVAKPNVAGPRTDGTSVIFRSPDPDQLRLLKPEGGTELLSGWSGEFGSGLWDIENGWIAYPKVGPSNYWQVWRRSPAGIAEQLSLFSAYSRFETLGGDGSVTFKTTNPYYQRFLALPGQELIQLSIDKGRAIYDNGHWWVIMGRMLFSVGEPPISPPMVDAGAPDSGVFDAGLVDATSVDGPLADAKLVDAGTADPLTDAMTETPQQSDAGNTEPEMKKDSNGGCTINAGGSGLLFLWFVILAISGRDRVRRLLGV